MKLLKLLSLFLITLFIFSYCNKEVNETIKDEAIILYEGDPAVDGCGYFLSINEVKYKPIELASDFSKDGLIVNVEYQLLDNKWYCNWQEKEYPLIKIVNISKK